MRVVAEAVLYFFCYAAFDVYADPNYGHTSMTLPLLGKVGGVSVVGLASLLLGVVLMLVQWAVQGSGFRSPDVPTGAHAAESGPAGEQPEAAPAT